MARTPNSTERLRKIIEAFPRLTITVLGDMVADEFVFGEISRVSREAPVLILRHKERDVVPGGGANAVNNLADLGVNVLPVGIVGNDEPGRLLLRSFRHKRIPVTGILKDKKFATVTKTRILAGMPHTWRQQVVRIDREPDQQPDAHASRELALAAREYLRVSDALLISDYGYGAATPEILNSVRDRRTPERIRLPRVPHPAPPGVGVKGWRVSRLSKRGRQFPKSGDQQNIPIVLDSRHRTLQFSGITAATPNEPEVEELLNIEIGQDWNKLCAAGNEIISRMKLDSLVITRGRDGMVAFSEKNRPVDIPIFGSDQVTDVTGAGDTVIAAFTAALAAGASAEDAAHLANYAGGIVVMKRGTATVSQQELIEALEKSSPRTRQH
ncbi:MAG TPA: PfkB family carbohydrate kinase [Terriglobales bacterium]|nr:PfkB family carbohydrate kinase [Terriglobales bacterium]